MCYLDLSVNRIFNVFLVSILMIQFYSVTTDEINVVTSPSSVTLPGSVSVAGSFSSPSTETSSPSPSSSSSSSSSSASLSSSTTISPSPSVSQTTTSDPNHQTWQRTYYINQGVHPWSYGYNTGIHPYTVTYNYPVTSTVVYPNMNANQQNQNDYNYYNNNHSNQPHEIVEMGQLFSTSPQPNQGSNHFPGFTNDDIGGIPLTDDRDNNEMVNLINGNGQTKSTLDTDEPFPVNPISGSDDVNEDFSLDDNSVSNDLPFNL